MADHQALLKEIDNYQDTVFGILAFLNECGWSVENKSMDPELAFGLGRKMTTSTSNQVSPSTEVTPDLVVQRGKLLQLVAEAKHSWSSEGDWKDVLEQLSKYDDDLVGWWTPSEKLESLHDLVLLVHGSQAVRVCDFLRAQMEAGSFRPRRKLAVVTYQRVDQVQQFMQLRRECGEFSNQTFDQRLRQIVPVPVDKIVWRDKRFYDYPPPVPHLLVMLWDDVFGSLAEDFERAHGKPYTEIPIVVDKLTFQLQAFYGFPPDGKRNPGIPKQQSVREALEAFVSFGYAQKEGDGYIIHYRRLRGDKLVRFGKAWRKVRAIAARRRRRSAVTGPRRRGHVDGHPRLFE